MSRVPPTVQYRGWSILPLLLAIVVQTVRAQPGALAQNIGIEGVATHDLPRPDYRPRPLDDRTELILRIGSITGIANHQYRYQLHYMGLEPGDYRLADYLMRPDGSRPTELEEVQLTVRETLPRDHSGVLTPHRPGVFAFIGGYRLLLGLLGLLWLGGIAAFAWSYRNRQVVSPPVDVIPPPSFAERLQPLAEAAAAGRLSAGDKAEMERLLMGYWREKLGLLDLKMSEALARLKAHTQAGELLRAVERWLHQRSGKPAEEEVHRLLDPYRHVPPPQTLTGGPA